MENNYEWTDNPTVSGLSVCDTDILNDCLMHLKYENQTGLAYSFGDSKYSAVEITNLSWLVSNGQRNSGTVYKDYYDWLNDIYTGAKIQGGVSVKAVGDSTITPYDWQIDTSAEEFILPAKTRLIPLGDSAPVKLDTRSGSYDFYLWNSNGTPRNAKADVRTGDANNILYAGGNGAQRVRIIKNAQNETDFYADLSSTEQTGLYLYFYVGNTVKNQELIDVATLADGLAIKTDMEQAAKAGMPSGRYVDLTLGANGTHYTAPADGWFRFSKVTGTTNAYISLDNLNSGVGINNTGPGTSNQIDIYLPVQQGDEITANYSASGATKSFKFIYAEGAQ